MSAATPKRISLRLWEDSQKEVQESLEDPFVVSLGDGTLPKSVFQHYIGQDAYFLGAFAESYAMGMVHALQVEGNACDVMKELFDETREELKLHKGYAKQWGVDLSKINPSSSTLQYTNFLLGTAHGSKGITVLVASMLPCLALYQYLGSELAKGNPGAEHPYKDWIATYSSNEFKATCDKLGGILDDLAGGPNVDYGLLLTHYQRAMKLEKQFFASQPLSPSQCHAGNSTAPALRIFSIIDSDCNGSSEVLLTDVVSKVINGGSTIIAIRMKAIPTQQMVDLLKKCLTIGHREGVPILVTNRVDIAHAANADGVLLEKDDLSVAAARQILGHTKMVGVLVGGIDEAVSAEKDGADYLLAGVVYPSAMCPESPVIGLQAVKEICDTVTIPIVSFGGVDTSTAAGTIEVGCSGAAMSGSIFSSCDIEAKTRDLKDVVVGALEGSIA